MSSDDASDWVAMDANTLRTVSAPSQEAWTVFFSDVLDEDAQALADGYPVDEPVMNVDWQALYDYSTDLAWGVIKHPVKALGATHKLLTGTGQRALADRYSPVLSDVPIRVSNLPPDRNLRVGDLRTEMLGTLVDLEGEVVHVEAVEPWVQEAAYECRRCGKVSKWPQSYGILYQPPLCDGCETNKNQGIFRLIQDQSTLIDYQFAVLAPQESNLEDPPTVNLILKHDLVGRIEQGDELTVTGVYQTMPMDLQKETQLDVFIETVALDVDASREADKLPESELDGRILECVQLVDEETSDFGAHVEDVIQAVEDEHDIREQEVRNRIEGGFVDDNDAVSRGGTKLFIDDDG